MHQLQNFYSVSISGYHIAEAGANPISRLAFTLSAASPTWNRIWRAAYYIRAISHPTCPSSSTTAWLEYSVIGRVATASGPVAMKNKYGANERSQKLKYHIQTSGRFAARAGNGLQRHPHHAAGADRHLRQLQLACTPTPTTKAITTPTEESVRRAMAIQLIINREWASPRTRTRTRALRHRRTDRSGRRGRARRNSKPSPAAAACWCHGNRLPARQDPGRVDVLRAQATHDGSYPIIGGQHLPQSEGHGAAGNRTGLLDRRGKAVADHACAPSRRAMR